MRTTIRKGKHYTLRDNDGQSRVQVTDIDHRREVVSYTTDGSRYTSTADLVDFENRATPITERPTR